jgi:hypothetical protein
VTAYSRYSDIERKVIYDPGDSVTFGKKEVRVTCTTMQAMYSASLNFQDISNVSAFGALHERLCRKLGVVAHAFPQHSGS